MVLLKFNTVIRSGLYAFTAPGTSFGPPAQFRIGPSPLVIAIGVLEGVPHSLNRYAVSDPSSGILGILPSMVPPKPSIPPIPVGSDILFKVVPSFFERANTRSRSAHGMGFVPARTTAFKRLEPITAPTPLRAAMRPPSLQMPEIRDSRSPASPIEAMQGFFLRRVSRQMCSSVSVASMPQ